MTRSVNVVSGGLVVGAALAAGWLGLVPAPAPAARAADAAEVRRAQLEWQVPNEDLALAFKDVQPILFVNRSQNAAEWDQLPKFWNPAEETAVDPRTGKPATRK